jgi:Ca-activated chloride channel family protein
VPVFPPAVLGLVAFGLAAAVAAQDTTTPPIFKSSLDTVNVTVSVRDHEGRLISDLKAEDFLLFEDGHPQRIQVFARAVEPGQEQSLALDVGMLMDTSESMLKVLRLSQEAAVRFLENIPRAHDLVTIFFDNDIRISRFDSENQQGLFDRIMSSKANGTTALYDAITVYLSRVEDSPGRKVLVVFTDGEDSTSTITLSDLTHMLRSSSVIVYPIAMTGGMPTGSTRAITSMAFLRQVAELTGGQVFQPTFSGDLPKIYRSILEELTSQYVLGFSSDNTKQDGKFRKLRVAVKRQGLKVRHRQGYYASVK